ncbi:MAG TPA: hypothetical protein VFY36_07510 [Solirubrobacteraceae bacterium]|nr:hypothetical protein [Solirubrobacteraceae bacterium]
MRARCRETAARWAAVTTGALSIGLLSLGTSVSAAHAVAIAPGWAIGSLPQPSNFSNAENALCENGGEICDAYVVTVTNTGEAPSDGTPIVITDKLPQGLAAHSLEARDMETGQSLECLPEPIPLPEEGSEEPQPPTTEVICTFNGILRPGDVLYLKLNVTVTTNATFPLVSNVVEVQGGGAANATGSAPLVSANSLNSEAPAFGPQIFSVRAYGPDGALDTQAGDHPGMLITTLAYNTVNFAFTHPGTSTAEVSVQEPKTVIVNFPVGLVGNPLVAATCPEANLRENGPGCPADSQVGTVILNEHGRLSNSESEGISSSIYNMVPQDGNPMEFAFNVANEGEIVMYPRFIPTPSGYALSIAVPAQPKSALTPVGTTLMFFGDPARRGAELHQRAAERETGQPVALEQVTPAAMFTNPTDCSAEPASASVEMNSWVQPRHWVTTSSPVYEASPLRQLSECSALQFNAQIDVKPQETQIDTPSGYTVDIKVPQAPNFTPDLATPDLRDAELHLPVGVAISPSVGTGLVSCHATGPEGINITHGWAPTGAQPLDPAVPEAMEIGPDGLPHIAPGHCPDASRVGDVELVTPLLANPLTGHVYIAQPECGREGQPACTNEDAESGRLFGLYAEAAGSGVIIKLEGRISVDPDTGQMTVRFKDSPQMPFSDLQLRLKGGQRALLANPRGCAVARTTSRLTPWGAPEANVAEPSSAFEPTGCGAPEPFSPGFLAQTAAPSAAGASPLTVLVSRHDGEQGLRGLEVRFPPGLLGMLSKVATCPEPQASAGTCAVESEIGHMLVAVGSGSQPVWETGAVYLTGPYEGAPFGLSIVTPASVGPFNLGNVIMRAAIRVDPHTAALTIDAAELPRIVDGVPLRIQAIDLTIDRPGFIVNPTNCSRQQIAATVTGALADGSRGARAAVSTPFAASGCRGLAFAPKVTALVHAKTSKATGAYVRVSVTARPGQDNLGKVKVVLPKQLPSRLTTLQKACVAAVFEANPANCPPGSVVGTATAVTPLLKSPLRGPAYLVSHGGVEFPDLEIVLQSEGVTITLDGSTQIIKGATSSAFRALPDTPLTSFKLVLPDGPNALLGANTSLCAAKLSMPTALTAQSGAVIKQATRIAVSGCPKRHAKKARRARRPDTVRRAKKR